MSALMIQGTTSDAGKSTLVAGLARLLKRRGVSVAPFKPQNMALNSAVTAEGGEIGRAQALQAQACGLAAHTDMNPVLLKPASDTGAQVIVQGKVLGNMEALDYHAYKKTAREAVLQSFKRLQAHYDCVLVEGAGSPAEINLRENDIANMGFAEAVDCPVVLVADIDRGGVFAHLVGTLALLSDTERARVCGFIINRFRGDLALLQSGLDWLEQYTGKPVLGVLPYLKDFYLDAEDAIDTRQRHQTTALNVVVPVLSRISNHTDFDPLRLHPSVNLSFVCLKEPLPPCDLVILPGSKNVRLDLRVLRECGWPAMLDKHLRYGGKLMGICGGLQMLGQAVNDPDGVEDKPGSEPGLGYLDFVTDLQPAKTLCNLAGTLRLNHKSAGFYGYEIHCGVSEGPGLSRAPLLIDATECTREDGALSADNQILATYVHGLFERPQALALLLEWAGLPPEHNTRFELAGYREHQIERLADTLEASLDDQWLRDLEGAV